jgi:TonB family protein
MSQEKTAEIIDLSASRAAAAGEGTGPFLAQARVAAGLHVIEVAEATKIKQIHIEAIEAGDADALPATPFAVGFVKVYAAYLGLDAEAVAADFKKELIAVRPQAEAPAPSSIPATAVGGGVKLASLLGIVLIAVFAIWIGVQIAGHSEREAAGADAAEAGPRVTVSDRRAEAPRPRVSAPGEYEVTPIPPVGANAAGETDEAGAGAAGAGEKASAGEKRGPLDEAAPMLAPILAPAEPSAIGAAPSETTTPAPTVIEPTEAAPAVVREPRAPASRPESRPEPQPVVIDARLTRSIGPEYPSRCERGAQGLESVSVMFDVNANGRTTNPRVTSSTNSCFEDAAVAAIARWRFDPRTVDGAPRPQTGVQATLNFRR